MPRRRVGGAAVETATVIRSCETFQARRPATRHRAFREVRCFCTWCVAAGFLDHTPFRGLRNVRLPSAGVQPFRPAELARLVAACELATAVGRRDAALVLLFLDTGIRGAELSALDRADCALPRGRLRIRHGKGHKHRVVPCARRCQAALEADLAARRAAPAQRPQAAAPPPLALLALRSDAQGLRVRRTRAPRAPHPACVGPEASLQFPLWEPAPSASPRSANRLLLRGPIERALRTDSVDDLLTLSRYPGGFWEVLEEVPPVAWSGEQPADVLNAARCLDRSGLLAGNDARAEPAVVRSAMSTAAKSIGQWPAFDEETAAGVAAAIRLDPDTALARSLWAAASATPVEADQARAWVTAVLVPVIEADQRGLTESYATGIVIPTDAAGFLQACAELISADHPARLWAAFRVSPNVDIMGALTSAISAEPSEELVATVRVLRAAGTDIAWNELGDATFDRLGDVDSVEPSHLRPLIDCMWQLQPISEHIQGSLKTWARQGHLLHYAQQAWERDDLDTAAWCVFLFLRSKPDAVPEPLVGDSQTGLNRLTAIFESPQDHEPFVSAFVQRITAVAEPGVLFSVLDQAPQSRPFIHACFRQLVPEPRFAEQLTPTLLADRWQPLMAALQEDSPDTFDELVARVDARASLSEYVMEAPFTPSRDGLYAALLRRAGAENAAFREWYVAGVETLDTTAWGEQLDAPGHVIQTLIDLRRRGVTVQVGRPFVDALIARAKDAVTGQFTSEHFVTAWQEVLALLPADCLLLLVRKLYQALQSVDGNISETFFEMYGAALADHHDILSDDNVFMLFDDLLMARNGPGLEWAQASSR